MRISLQEVNTSFLDFWIIVKQDNKQTLLISLINQNQKFILSWTDLSKFFITFILNNSSDLKCNFRLRKQDRKEHRQTFQSIVYSVGLPRVLHEKHPQEQVNVVSEFVAVGVSNLP